MGKDLRGKEIGVGLCQEKNGLYLARYTDRFGKRVSKRFVSIQECRNWYADAMYRNEHYDVYDPSNMTVDGWYEIWYKNKETTTKATTANNYRTQYQRNIKDVLGAMKIVDVKPMHCQLVFNKMADRGLKSSTIGVTKVALHNFFAYAVANGVINSNPCNKLVKADIGEESEEKEALTRSEQTLFLQSIQGRKHENVYRFVLQTGLRGGELAALKWSDVDFKARKIRVTETTYRDSGIKVGSPKTKSGVRTIPLTDEAYAILMKQKKVKSKVVPIEWKGYIFVNTNTGVPLMRERYDEDLTEICEKYGLRHISLHILRHTFATRCIEAGMKPKTLQKILGHKNISTTMNRYVHTTEDEKAREMALVARLLIV